MSKVTPQKKDMEDIMEASKVAALHGHDMINELEDVWNISGPALTRFVINNGFVDNMFGVGPTTAFLEGFFTCLQLFKDELAFARGNM